MKFRDLTLLSLFAILTACGSDEPTPTPPTPLEPVVSMAEIEVLDYSPAPGQFINELPPYEVGNTAADMAAKAENYLTSGNMVCLGGWGGNVTIRLKKPLARVEGKPSFRVLGNAFYSDGSTTVPRYGSSEPGVILVMADKNGNGKPDDGEWLEIAGSETAYSIESYTVTYTRPDVEPSDLDVDDYIAWKASDGASGFIPKLQYHIQPYFPQWITAKTLTFKGRRLPDNGVLNEETGFYEQRCFDFGYADAHPNTADESLIYLDWAVNSKGEQGVVDKIDFIKVYTGVLQVNGWLGECSTEISGIQRIDYVSK